MNLCLGMETEGMPHTSGLNVLSIAIHNLTLPKKKGIMLYNEIIK